MPLLFAAALSCALLPLMLQRMGIETDKFASATGTMRGLEMS